VKGIKDDVARQRRTGKVILNPRVLVLEDFKRYAGGTIMEDEFDGAL
jgi:hypothetical protein